MHPRIREIIETSNFCHAAVKEVAALLPEDDAELDGWIGQVVEEHDALAFFYLLASASHLGRKVDCRHLEGGMQLMPHPGYCSCLIWHLDGEDLPERVLAGLERGGINPGTQANAYFTGWRWCVERRDGALPVGFVASMRRFCQAKHCPKEFMHILSILAGRLKDGPMLASLDATLEQMEAATVAAASLKVEDAFMQYARGSILDLIPVEPVLNHTGFTMRRSVENIGRNEPCPCGSGNKYKRCCAESDRRRLSLSSDVAGKTRHEVRRAAPTEFLTAARLEKLHPPEMARIDPLEIDEELVEPYLIRLAVFGMFGEAAAALEALGWSDGIANAWMGVIRYATLAGRKDIAERLVEVRGEFTPGMELLYPNTRLLLAKDDPAETLKLLDELAMDVLRSQDGNELANVTYGMLQSIVPAVGILVARGMIPVLDPKTAVATLDHILASRTRLELSDDEPYSEIMDMLLAAKSAASGKKNAEALRLANQKLEAKAGEVRKMKHEIDEMKHEIARREKLAAAPVAKTKTPTPADEQSLQDLRGKVRFLKDSLKERHEERAILRRDLEKTLTDLEALRERQAHDEAHPEPAAAIDPEDLLVLPGEVEGNQPVRMIEFPKKFHRTLEGLPKQVGKGAMVLLGRLAAGEPAAFTGVVRLKASPDTLRARIGIDHRLLFRLLPDSVQVVDLINRRDLESRIKQL